MGPLTCRLLPFAAADGPHNMAADEALLRSAADGVASLRFYTWDRPTASLGYFQPAAVLRDDAQVAPLPWLRRPSGGLTLVHHHELTYALALPAERRWQDGQSWLCRMHKMIAKALAAPEFGVETRLVAAGAEQHKPSSLCFHHLTAGDLIIGDAKVVGSAQRKHRGALLQHGAILLAQSEHTPTLPGIAEQTGRKLSVEDVIVRLWWEFAAETGCSIILHSEWTAVERQATEELVRERFSHAVWNHKR